ncbi:DNA helicase-2/ATP-dependent DNA helicase PcrA [Anaerosolibacter carboniphilus]|uniref:DNA 3'-5' helicase n=1 Tax=Anaerosolibacter carboniphilus TaxID=1417629 RepID=A0A841KJP9_9FIRM|nr:RNA polymerase recycling motor HelD [Anaerosolibacter carboniphilus]MBB6214094.1 DNA helicase-2/ATP-dependent DNA helicase PcrA [Anaerosolibacter carboniphilus]
MPVTNHPDYQLEKDHLEETIEWIEGEKEFLEEYEGILKERLKEIRKSVRSLTDERLIANQQLYNIATKDIGSLNRSKDNPYFGRVDFQENRREERETIYIGKYGLHDRDREVPVVVDWRAPIADIYYSSHSQEVSYKSPSGEIKGNMFLKRRYEIDEGELKEIFDDKTSEDRIEDSLKGRSGFLTEALNKTTQGRLKEIVATIQDQQNKIIRSEMIRPLVVQGVAGSGKTTIALHRMAYLIYNNRRNTDANYMVIAPNKLFLNYISDILPDLGVENVFQTTFEDWALGLLHKKIGITQSSDKLNLLMNGNTEEVETITLASRMKGSLLFKKVIDNRLKQLERSLLPSVNLSMEGIDLLTYEKIQEVFLTSSVHLSLVQRIGKLHDYLKGRLKKDIKEVHERIEAIYDQKIRTIKNQAEDIEAIRKDIIALYDERDRKLEKIKDNLPVVIEEYIGKIVQPDTFQFYRSLFDKDEELEKAFANKIGQDMYAEVCRHTLEKLIKNVYENEDLGPLAYIHIKLFGIEDRNRYAHIVVDEAQDLDEFKMSVLREISMNDSFTFVGDLSQGIYSYRGINNWEKTMEKVFKDKEYNYHLLTTSYRSTIEIVALANEVIKQCKGLEAVLAEPIFRHGEKPILHQCKDEAAVLQQMVYQIKALQQEDFGSIAVICKDLHSTEMVYECLKDQFEDIHLISDHVTDFHGGVVVIPSYLSKGLEFDGVLIHRVDPSTYADTEMDIKLLYIAITRALHRVYMYCIQERAKVLEKSREFYGVK